MPHATLHIAQPCAESWATMTPASGGRHCAACQKTVVDFTQKTDAEILVALRRAAGETCGRLRADQVGRALIAPSSAPRWRAWLGAVLALGGALGAGQAAAQARTNYYAGPQPAASPTGHAANSEPGRNAAPVEPAGAANGPATLRGIVIDSATHQGLPGVTVLLKGTDVGVSTDADGNFVLPVAASAAPVQLAFSSIGFASQERTVVAPGSQPLAVTLTADVHMLGEMEVIVTDFKQPWHPRRLFNWGIYWVTKPFRN